ncbi:MAG: hypothetical protein PHV73_03860 [Eubacteriales bacterium]|nr:hypothetical protein [Eubacteriales bacterium]
MMSRNRPRHLSRNCRISLMLILAFLVSFFLLSACSLLELNPSDRPAQEEELFIKPENGVYLNEVESVRTLILAMDNTDKIESIWQHIPARQRSEISISLFVSYVRILNQVLQNDVVSFSEATADETEAMRLNISRSVPALSDEADQSSFWYIITQDSNNRQDRFVISINKTQDGMPYFSADWVAKQSFLYDYIRLYFSALEEKNSAALYDLLHQQQFINLSSYEQATLSRVEGLLEYYDEFSAVQLRAYRIVELLPGSARVVQSNLPGGSGNRTVSFRESNSVISVSERIPQLLDLNDTEIRLSEELSFRLESITRRLQSASTLPVLGIPLDIRILTDDEGIDPNEVTQAEDVNFRVTWPGIHIDAFGSFDTGALSFNGVIKQIDLFYTDYETLSGLSVGDPINYLYIKYPFARENDYLIRGEREGIDFTLAVQVESDYIARLTILSEEAPVS